MKSFLHQYSYSVIKMFVNQFAISIFGVMMAMATTAAGNGVLTWITGIFSIIFYLFLIYTMTWEVGSKDRISVDIGKKPYRPHTGLLMALIANIPNLLIAIVYTIGYPMMETHKWAGNMNAVANLAAALLEGMYRGVLTMITVGGRSLYFYWWSYFVIVIPALVTAWLAYYAGFKNFRLLAPYFDTKKSEQEKRK